MMTMTTIETRKAAIMFSRFYLVLGLIALGLFSYAQYRGVSPFDTYANTPGNMTRGGTSNTYHK